MKIRLVKKKLKRCFPRLKSTRCHITSPRTTQYNCIAWAAGKTDRWWQPGYYWPIADQSETIESLVKVFEALGFVQCAYEDRNVEQGCDKVALYEDKCGYSHAAKLLDNGLWSSKLGKSYDISHALPEDVAS